MLTNKCLVIFGGKLKNIWHLHLPWCIYKYFACGTEWNSIMFSNFYQINMNIMPNWMSILWQILWWCCMCHRLCGSCVALHKPAKLWMALWQNPSLQKTITFNQIISGTINKWYIPIIIGGNVIRKGISDLVMLALCLLASCGK